MVNVLNTDISGPIFTMRQTLKLDYIECIFGINTKIQKWFISFCTIMLRKNFKIFTAFLLINCTIFTIYHSYAQIDTVRIEALNRKLSTVGEDKRSDILFELGKLYSNSDSIKTGIQFLKLALNDFEKKNDYKKVVETKCLLGDLYILMDDLINSFDNYYPGYLLSKKYNYEQSELQCAVGLSEFFFTFKDNKNARFYIQETFELSKKTGSKDYESKLYNLLGLICMDEKKQDSAYYYFHKAIEKESNNSNTKIYLHALNNYNYLLIQQDSISKALHNFKDLLVRYQSHLKPRSKVSIYSNMGSCYQKLNEINRAKECFYASLKISQANEFPIINAYNCGKLAEIYRKERNLDSAFYFHNLYFEYHETLYNLQKLNKIHDLVKKLEDDKIIGQNEIYRNTLKIRKLELFIAVFAVIILVFIIFNLQSFYRKRIKAKEKQTLLMQDTLSSKSRELVSMSINLDEKNILLSNLNKTVKTAKNSTQKKQMKTALEDINSKLSVDSYYEQNSDKFLLHFSEVHPAFFENIQKTHPELTRTELRHCAYIKLNLATKEIAIMNGISMNTVQMTRYRLKKKLNLQQDDNLSLYINKF